MRGAGIRCTLLYPWTFFFFFFPRFYLLISERREGREKERERNIYVQEIHRLVAFYTSPTGDLAINLGMCPDQESNQWPLGSQVGTQSIEPHQPGLSLGFMCLCCSVFTYTFGKYDLSKVRI